MFSLMPTVFDKCCGFMNVKKDLRIRKNKTSYSVYECIIIMQHAGFSCERRLKVHTTREQLEYSRETTQETGVIDGTRG